MNRWLRVVALGVLLTGLLLGVATGTQAAPAAPTFQSVQSGPWSDPATWGRTGTPEPDVTIPGPTSNVIIAQGTTVLLSAPLQVDTLTVNGGATLRARPGTSIVLQAATSIRNSGALLAGEGTSTQPAGSVRLRTSTGDIFNEGIIWGGDAGTYGGPGGAVLLLADAGNVENWGDIRGGRGAENSSGGWVMLEAAQGIVRNRGQVQGGPGQGENGRGGHVLLRGVTVDMIGGRALGGTGTAMYGRATLSAQQAILASGRRTRLSGQGVYAIVDGGMLDLHNLETMSVLGRDALWLIGQSGARLNLAANQARFAPLRAETGAVHLWFDPDQRFLDPGLNLTDVISGTVDTAIGRAVAIPRVLPRTWNAGKPGKRVRWQVDIVNMGNTTAPVQLHIRDEQEWAISVEPTDARLLLPGERWPVTLTLDIPATATIGATNHITLEASAGTDDPLVDRVVLPLPVRPGPTYLPWLGHRANPESLNTLARPHPRAQAPQVDLTWPGAAQGQGIAGRALLLIVDRSGGQEVSGGDLAYWDGLRWVPFATTADMQNFIEDGIWYTFWDTSDIPLNFVYVRARLWSNTGEIGETVRAVTLHHPPVAQGTATFRGDGTVLLDAGSSSDLDNDIESYRWDVGDEQVLEGKQVSYTFAPGTHIIRLHVQDATGLTDEAVYLLDTNTDTWKEQTECGCASLRLLTSGSPPLRLPWEDDTHQMLGLDVAPLASGRMARLNLAVDATLTPESNARYCRVAQWGRLTWSWQGATGPQQRSWQWNGQTFAESSIGRNGLVGYTRPSSVLTAEGTGVQWVLSPGWGWRGLAQGLPESAFSDDGVRVMGTYRAEISGSQGTCGCAWHISVVIPTTGPPTVDVQSDCP